MKATMLWLSLALSTVACGQTSAPPPPLDPALARYVLDDVPTDIPHKAFFDFEGKVHLLGYAIAPEGEAKPGSTVKVTLYWKSVSPLRGGWQLFTHLTNRGRLVKNLDGNGPLREMTTVNGRDIQKLAPAFWQPGHVYVDEQSFEVPSDTDAPELTFTVGIWQDGAWVKKPAAEPSAAQKPELPGARLGVLSGASDGESRAVVVRIPTGVAPTTKIAKQQGK
jgi:hypothetical protein